MANAKPQTGRILGTTHEGRVMDLDPADFDYFGRQMSALCPERL